MLGRLSIIALFLSVILATSIGAQDASPSDDLGNAVAKASEDSGETVALPDKTQPVISDFAEDVELLKAVVEGEGDDKLTKRFDQLKKKKDKEELETFKQDLMKSQAARDAWRDALLNKYGITAEILATDWLTEEQLDKRYAEEYTQRLQKEFPPNAIKVWEKRAVDKYPTVAVGQTVNVRLRTGRTVSGRLSRLGATEAVIGGVSVSILDLDSRFRVGEMKRKRFLFVKTNYYDRQKAYKAMLKTKLRPFLYKKHGYVVYDGKWVPAKQLAETIDGRIAYLSREGEKNEIEHERRVANIKGIAIKVGIGFGVFVVVIAVLAVALRKKK